MEISDLRKRDTAFTDGEWVGDLPGCGDMRVKVRALQSPQALSNWGRLARAASSDQREADGSLTPEAQAALDRQVLVESVLLDWDGLTDNGDPVPYSKETALEFVHVGLFEAAVRYAAAKVSNEIADQKEALSGNSATPSGGGSGRGKRRKKDDAT